MSQAGYQQVLEEILADYRQIMALESPDLDTLNNLGGLLCQAGRPAEAVDCFQRLLAVAPENQRAHYNLSTALLALARHQEAAAAARWAWQLAPDHFEALNNLGVALVALGRASEAVGHFQQVLALQPHYAPALNNLARVYRAFGQLPEALACARQAIALRPDLPEAHYNLAKTLTDMGQPEEALPHYYQALHQSPDYPEALSCLFLCLANNPHLNQASENGPLMNAKTPTTEHGDGGQTQDDLEAFWQAAPQDPDLHRKVAAEKQAHGDELGALAHLIAAQTLESCAQTVQPEALHRLCNVGHAYFMKEDNITAERWYKLVLMIDNNVAAVHQNLGVIYARTGRPEEAEFHREKAYQIQRVFIESPANPLRRLLILCVGRGDGNVPFETLLSSGTACRIKYALDYAPDEEDAQLPEYNLVFNAIGDPDVAAALAPRLERFCQRSQRPMLNPPGKVLRTKRHEMKKLLGDIKNVVVSPCITVAPPFSEASLRGLLARGGLEFPALLRPAASHGGVGLQRCDDLSALAANLRAADGPHYITAYKDYQSPDGYYRKYRVVFVDRQPFPYHLAISPHWVVHYYTAEMENNPWKIEEEHNFLKTPQAALGSRAMAAVAAIGRRLDLDYAGVDFTLLPDGRIFVFEANATMLIHKQGVNSILAHKNPYVQRIVDAFENLQARLSVF